MFYIFKSQEERRNFGGSAFLEIQFCRLPLGTKIDKITAIDSITNWQNDSLYTDDENWFYEQYSAIFSCGVYNNLKTGTVDVYGINYYSPGQTDLIIEKLQTKQPECYMVLIEWLREAKNYNGFYILGI